MKKRGFLLIYGIFITALVFILVIGIYEEKRDREAIKAYSNDYYKKDYETEAKLYKKLSWIFESGYEDNIKSYLKVKDKNKLLTNDENFEVTEDVDFPSLKITIKNGFANTGSIYQAGLGLVAPFIKEKGPFVEDISNYGIFNQLIAEEKSLDKVSFLENGLAYKGQSNPYSNDLYFCKRDDLEKYLKEVEEIKNKENKGENTDKKTEVNQEDKSNDEDNKVDEPNSDGKKEEKTYSLKEPEFELIKKDYSLLSVFPSDTFYYCPKDEKGNYTLGANKVSGILVFDEKTKIDSDLDINGIVVLNGVPDHINGKVSINGRLYAGRYSASIENYLKSNSDINRNKCIFTKEERSTLVNVVQKAIYFKGVYRPKINYIKKIQ